MRLIRGLITLAVAAVVVLVGLAVLAHGRPPVGTVYDTDARAPVITLGDGARPPRFRVLVGTSRKAAHWTDVNVAQYASCSAGDQWNGQLCSKAALELGSARPAGRTVTLWLLAAGMVLTPVAGGLLKGRPHD